MGDALMVTLMKLRGFKAGDYAKLHPGGSLGKRLLYKVKDYMRTENLPFVDENSDITDTIFEINRSKLGLCLVGNKNNVLGIITDGDLRRAMKKHKRDFFDLTPKDIYTKNPIFIDKEVKLITAQELLNKNKISSLLVGNKTNVEGVIELYDIKL
jgi:arabinose-5-phosphate isomerase